MGGGNVKRGTHFCARNIYPHEFLKNHVFLSRHKLQFREYLLGEGGNALYKTITGGKHEELKSFAPQSV